jgi:hypothetical protein
LIGTNVVAGNRNKSLTWQVRRDVLKSEVPEDKEFDKVGICNFNFNNKTEPAPSGDPRERRINLLHLLIHLWPGNWQEQLNALNTHIRTKNEKAKSEKRYGRAKVVREISEREFWVWWGIVITARIEGRRGNMWDRTEPEGYGKKST